MELAQSRQGALASLRPGCWEPAQSRQGHDWSRAVWAGSSLGRLQTSVTSLSETGCILRRHHPAPLPHRAHKGRWAAARFAAGFPAVTVDHARHGTRDARDNYGSREITVTVDHGRHGSRGSLRCMRAEGRRCDSGRVRLLPPPPGRQCRDCRPRVTLAR